VAMRVEDEGAKRVRQGGWEAKTHQARAWLARGMSCGQEPLSDF